MSVFHIPETKFQAEEATDSRPKPFLKWVGGKGQLLHQFDTLFPRTFHHYNVRNKMSCYTITSH